MKTTEEMIKVMKAFTEGKKIKFYNNYRNGGWEECPTPAWDWFSYDYMIEEEPKYRPYESTDEMIKDLCERAGLEPTSMLTPVIWLKEKNDNIKTLILSFAKNSVCTYFGNYLSNWSLDKLFDEFTYLDGSPVGKEITE